MLTERMIAVFAWKQTFWDFTKQTPFTWNKKLKKQSPSSRCQYVIWLLFCLFILSFQGVVVFRTVSQIWIQDLGFKSFTANVIYICFVSLLLSFMAYIVKSRDILGNDIHKMVILDIQLKGEL